VPDAYLQRFASVDYKGRRLYAAMVNYMDDAVAQIVTALKAKAMWDSTLMLFTSDNGGPIYYPGSANNFPLKGGKMADWEGGVRVNAFLAGGVVPKDARGTKLDALVHIADWYATFTALAGVVNGTSDPVAAAAGLPPVDSINMWPLISGEPTQANATAAAVRSEVHLSAESLIIRGDSGELYKLITGVQAGSGWVGPSYPNRTGHQPLPCLPGRHFKFGTWSYDCGAGCLYDVEADETEHVELAAKLPAVAARLQARLKELNRHNYNPNRGVGDRAACHAAEERYRGFYGPWVYV